MRWLMSSPVDAAARCDRSFRHLVAADQPRLQVASGLGPTRKRGKSRRNEYLCVACAAKYYGTKPPSVMKVNQEKMF